jgi:hypothetical protein
MFKLETAGARLALLTIRPPLLANEAEDMVTAVRLHSTAAGKAIYCTDVRSTRAFAPEVIDQIIVMMTKGNPFLVRSGILYSSGSSMGLQVLRAVRAANGGDKRKAFDDPKQLIKWLSEVLTEEEKQQLLQLLTRETD